MLISGEVISLEDAFGSSLSGISGTIEWFIWLLFSRLSTVSLCSSQVIFAPVSSTMVCIWELYSLLSLLDSCSILAISSSGRVGSACGILDAIAFGISKKTLKGLGVGDFFPFLLPERLLLAGVQSAFLVLGYSFVEGAPWLVAGSVVAVGCELLL